MLKGSRGNQKEILRKKSHIVHGFCSEEASEGSRLCSYTSWTGLCPYYNVALVVLFTRYSCQKGRVVEGKDPLSTSCGAKMELVNNFMFLGINIDLLWLAHITREIAKNP